MLTGLAAAFFYLFAFIMLASAIMVVSVRNPVHSVLFLIVVFVNAAAWRGGGFVPVRRHDAGC